MGSFKQRAIKIICISSGDLSGFSGLRVAARGPEERSTGGVGAGVALRGLMIIMCLELSGERERKRERERKNQHNS